MSFLGISDDFKQWHTCPVIIDKHLSSMINTFSCILLHLNPLDFYRIGLIFEIEEVKLAIFHDRIVLLSDLITLR